MKLLEYFFILSVAFLGFSASADDAEAHNNKTSDATHTPITESTPLTSVAMPPGTSTPGPSSLIPNTTTTPGAPSTTPEVVSTSTTESPGSSDLMLVVNNSGIACIIAKMEITLSLEYKNTNGSTVNGNFVIMSATVDPDKSSQCTKPAQEVEEDLYADFNENNTLHFLFNHTTANKFAVTLFQLSTNLNSLFPDAMEGQNINLQSNESIFETSSNMSFRCNSETKVDLVDTNKIATNNSVLFKMVQVEAFRTSADSNFADAIDCEDDEISNIVPIAVGCALAGLVVIVLIAYLVGRRQKRQRGYESV